MNPWQYAKPGCSEHASQVALFMWANMAQRYGLTVANDPRAYNDKAYADKLGQYHGKPLPQLKWLFAIPNGGERAISVAASMAAEGAKRGVADVCLPVPIRVSYDDTRFHGLFIEMKKEMYRNHKDGGMKPEQLDFNIDMLEAGYDCKVCYTWLEARDAIVSYLGA